MAAQRVTRMLDGVNDISRLLEEFPLLVPVDPAGAEYEGFITLQGLRGTPNLWLKISNPAVTGRQAAMLRVSDELRHLLGSHEATMVQQLLSSKDLHSYLLDLRNQLEQRVTSSRVQEQQLPLGFYQQLHQELEQVGWSNVHGINHATCSIELDLMDASGRSHRVAVRLVGGTLEQPPAAHADLPTPLDLKWGSGSGLLSVVQQYQRAFDACRDLWDCLDDIDANARVLEPAVPRRCDIARRLALGPHAFLRLVLDPGQPFGPPAECQFLGSTGVVGPLQERYYGGQEQWDPSRLPTANLEAILGMKLPGSEELPEEDLNADCAICYAFYLPDPQRPDFPGDAPEASCPHPPCSRSFHQRCLAEWLGALESTSRVLNTLFGKCPYCEEPITARSLV